MGEVGKILYLVVVDDADKKDNNNNKGKDSFRYTRPVLQSTLQLIGCKARHAFKVFSLLFLSFRFKSKLFLLFFSFLFNRASIISDLLVLHSTLFYLLVLHLDMLYVFNY